jgi:hypothetical protein
MRNLRSMDDDAALAVLLKHGHREGNVYVLDAPRCPAAVREAVQAWGHARGWVRDHVSNSPDRGVAPATKPASWQLRVPAESINRRPS